MKPIKSMRYGTRILAAFWLVLIVAICIPGIYIYYALKNDIIETSRQEAFTNLDFMAFLTGRQQPFATDRDLDDWAALVAQKAGYRITVIEPDGRVAADSDVAWENVADMENHAWRQEVAAARRTGQGSAIRYSDTLDRHLIYAARQCTLENYPTPMIIRIAMPFSAVEARLHDYAKQFWLINAIIFILALTLSVYFARRFESPVHQIIDRLQKIGTGDYSHRYITDDSREFSLLSGNINEMADRISRQVETITRQKYELVVIIENMREGIMLLDPEGRIKAINHVVADLAGCRDSCIGKKPVEIFLHAGIQAACDSVLAGSPEYTLTLEHYNDRFYEVYLAGIPEGGVLAVFYDISERKRLEKIRRDFVANVSHELKTPLTSITGYVETLLSGSFEFDTDAASFLQVIDKNAKHMTSIVDDLLALTSLQNRPFGQNTDTVDAAACLRSALERSLPMAREKTITIDNRLEAPRLVTADETALVRVFDNLIDNAIRYSPEGSAISISSADLENKIIFAVEDEGPGIAKNHQVRIFERFYRIEKERSRATGGTGLGLAICKNAVSGMGGEIWVQSPPEGKTRGSIFFFSLSRANG